MRHLLAFTAFSTLLISALFAADYTLTIDSRLSLKQMEPSP